MVAEAALHRAAVLEGPPGAGLPAGHPQPHQQLHAAVRPLRGTRPRVRQRDADDRLRHELHEPAVRPVRRHGHRLVDHHRHPPVHLPAGGPARCPRRRRQVMATARPAPRKGKGRAGSEEAQRLMPTPLLATLTTLLCLMVLIPVAYIVLASLNSDAGVASGEFWPSSFSGESYTLIWSTVGLSKALVNSFIVAGAVAIASALLAVPTAYVLVRYAFRGRVTILRGLLGFQSIPGTLMLLPVFVLFSSIGSTLGIAIIGTLWGLFIAYLTFALPFSTWVMVTYLRGLPRELEEAARIDGASNVQILARIIFPLSGPAIVVSGIFAFLLGWNDVLFASVMTRPDTHTAAIALQVFGASMEGGAIPVYSQMMAASLVCAAPVVILYFVFHRYLVGGLTAGSVK